MASPQAAENTENSLEKIKRQLASASGRNLLQGPLLKRSETLRKWNERWVILDPTTGRMEYKIRRNEPAVKGTIIFDANSTITVSPVNFHGLPKYDGCCIYIGTPQKKDYFLCAETPGAARAWVSTLHATQLVLKAHKEAVNSLSGNGSTKLGTVATVVAAANSTALECSKEIEAAMQISLRNALGMMTNRTTDGPMDDLTIMKETLRVKDEELQNLARDLRTRDSTIKDIADKLSETAEAAEAAASAAYTIDEQRRIVCAEIERLKKDSDKQQEVSAQKLKGSEENIMSLSKEKEQLIKQRDAAIQEANMWRSELAKAREHDVILEAAVVRAEEKVRVAEANAEARIKEAMQRESAAVKEKQELLAYVNVLKAQLQRQHIDTTQVFEKTESCSSDTKHVDPTEENVDKACLSVSRATPVPAESVVHMATDQVNIQPVGDNEWSDIQATEARIADVREVASETDGSSLDIPVVSQPGTNHHHEQGGGNSFHQPPKSTEIVREFPHLFRLYKDGRVERFIGTETTPTGTDPVTGVQSKDVTINTQTGVGARLYLPPNASSSSQKLPLLIYIHGGAFCICTPYNTSYHRHLNTVSAEANAVVLSVHYRLAPEHPLPIAYDDTWEAIQWASTAAGGSEPWLKDHADLGVVFLAGDSAGATLAHNMAMRGSTEGFGDLKLQGMVLIHPYFGNDQKDELVEFLYPTYGGIDDPKIHSTRDPKLSGLGCKRVLVLVAEKDFLRERGRSYHEALKKSGWNGVVDMVETQGEDHVFHLFDPTKENSVALVKSYISFMKQVEKEVRC